MFQLSNYVPSHSASPLPAAVANIIEVNLAYGTKTGRIVVGIFQDVASYQAGKPEIGQFAYPLGPAPANGWPDFDTLVSTPLPAATLNQEVQVGVTPVYKISEKVITDVLLTLPEFAGAVILDEGEGEIPIGP
jgi:hypothetical protein